MSTTSEVLANIVGADNVHVDEPLSNHTTFKIGGPADVLVEPENIEEIVAVIKACREAGVALHYLGLGSNVLASDQGISGVVLKLEKRFSEIRMTDDALICQAGASNADVAERALAAHLAGYEFASGIPGTIGGAAVMNAGAYGGEFRDVCTEVTCVTLTGDVVRVSADEADWGYRHSMMMDRGYLVVGATLHLTVGNEQEIRALMDDLKHRREEKQPLEMPSAGSTFKRPEGYFAGKLIQDAGMQGHTVGGAQVSEKHAGFVVNRGNATAADVRAVIADVQQAVYDMEGVRLEPEVRMWGF